MYDECPFCEEAKPKVILEDFKMNLKGKIVIVRNTRFWKCDECEHSWLPAEEEARIDSKIKEMRT